MAAGKFNKGLVYVANSSWMTCLPSTGQNETRNQREQRQKKLVKQVFALKLGWAGRFVCDQHKAPNQYIIYIHFKLESLLSLKSLS